MGSAEEVNKWNCIIFRSVDVNALKDIADFKSYF